MEREDGCLKHVPNLGAVIFVNQPVQYLYQAVLRFRDGRDDKVFFKISSAEVWQLEDPTSVVTSASMDRIIITSAQGVTEFDIHARTATTTWYPPL